MKSGKDVPPHKANRLVLAGAASCFLFLFLVLLFGVSEAGVPKAHKVCSSCHAGQGPPVLREGINETCIGCHPASPGKDHPVDVVQKEAPEKLPLAKGNRITCITCHEPHGKGTYDRLLRMEFNRLCIACHKRV